jgi:hypothetical protein
MSREQHGAACDNLEHARLLANLNQPAASLTNYTAQGVVRMSAPSGLADQLARFWAANQVPVGDIVVAFCADGNPHKLE